MCQYIKDKRLDKRAGFVAAERSSADIGKASFATTDKIVVSLPDDTSGSRELALKRCGFLFHISSTHRGEGRVRGSLNPPFLFPLCQRGIEGDFSVRRQAGATTS